MLEAASTALQAEISGPLGPLLARFAINVTAMTVLVFGLYYRRYRDKDIVTAASLFNIFVFAVLAILSRIEVSVAAGFGLFAILALFTLRSEPISKVEMPYFFGSVAIAVICAVQGTTLAFVAAVATLVLVGAYILDHPRVLQSVDGVKITLDEIDREALSDPVAMRRSLTKRLGVDVTHYQIISLDYVNELARINVFFRKGAAAVRQVPSPAQSPGARSAIAANGAGVSEAVTRA